MFDTVAHMVAEPGQGDDATVFSLQPSTGVRISLDADASDEIDDVKEKSQDGEGVPGSVDFCVQLRAVMAAINRL